MGRDFKMKKEPFFIILKGLFVAKNCLRLKSASLKLQMFCKALTKGLLNEVSFFIFLSELHLLNDLLGKL